MSAVELATAYISIVPSIKGLEGHLATALQSSEGEAKHAGEKAGEGFGGGFGERMKHVAEMAGIYEIGAKLKEFATDSIKYYMDVQRINAQTTTVITSTGGAAGVTAEHISHLSDELEAKTATEARSIQSGANMMLTFTGVKNAAGEGNDVFDQSVSVITDLSRVMGQDTKQSAIQLGKALNDPVTGMTALKRVGVSFSADQKDQIKQFVAANNIMGAQKIILAEMNKEFGGSGASYAKTMAGQQDLFKEATDKLGGSLVGLLAPALTTATTGLTGMLTKATEWVQKSGAIQSGFTTLKDGAKPFIDALLNIWHGFEDLAVKAWPYVRTFVESVGNGFKSLIDYITPVWQGVGTFITNLGKGSVVSTFGGALDGLGKAFEGVMKFVAPLGVVVGGLIGFLGKLPGPIWAAAAALGAFLLLRGPMTTMMTGIDGMGQSLMRLVSGGMLSGIKSLGTSLMAALGGPVGIAIIAVTAALAFLIPKFTEASTAEQGAANAAANHTTAVNDLAAALVTSNGLIDENIRKTALADLTQEKWGKNGANTDLTSYADRLAKLGVTYKDLVDGMLGVPGASKKIDDAYNSQVYQLDRVIAAGQRSGGAHRAERKAASDQAVEDKRILTEQHDAYAKMPGVINDATDKYRKNTEAVKGSTESVAAAAKAVATYNDFASHVPGITMTTDTKGITTFTTTTEAAFAQFKTDAADAATAASLFWFAMQDPTKATTQQIIYADAAAIRAVGSAYRTAAANAASVVTAQDALTKLQTDPLTAATKTSPGETQAERNIKIAAAQRALDDAKATSAGKDAAIFAAQETAGQTAAKRIADIAANTDTHAEAVKRVTQYLTDERAAFIAAQPEADRLNGKAAAAADAIDLIPGHAEIILNADNSQLLKSAKETADTASKWADKKYVARFAGDAAIHKQVLDEANRRVLANKTALLKGDPAPFNGTVTVVDGVSLPGKVIGIAGDTSKFDAAIASAVGNAQALIDGIHVGAGVPQSVMGSSDFHFPQKAGGGDISGAGTGTSDSVPFWGSTGEFVSTAASTARHHAQLVAWNAAPGKAAGGDLLRPMHQTGATGGPLIGTVIQQPGQSSWQLAADLDRRMAFMGGR